MGGNIIEVRDVTVRVKNRVILDRVRLTIGEGEVYSIIGKSGSGKTTLFRAILMLQPFSGSIKLMGEEISDLSEEKKNRLRKQCGVMFQAASLFTSLTVGENLSVMLTESVKLPSEVVEEIVRFKLSLVGLESDVYGFYPSELSGGMRKKAALARALMLDPAVLFLDEPTSGLDPVSAEEFDRTIRDLNRSLGITVVMITHDLDSFFGVSTRACVLGSGKVLAEGRPFDIINLEDEWIKRLFLGERGRKFQKWNRNPILR